ncbi:MAG: cation diffusion facilitator family transporter [Desulfovermiculus sp.]|nr:cation diffusion facilitator family transporter [Desulfovermiculus sp.]
MPETHPDNIQTEEDDEAQETRQIRRVALFAFLLNLFLAGLKIILAALSGSLAITAGAIDSATDSVASLAVFLGVVLSARKTKTFPLGLYKIENLISVVIAIFIFFAGYEIVQQMMQPGGIPRITWPILVFLFLSTAITYAFGLYALHQGRKTESPTLIAEGKHRQVDVVSSLVVLAAAALSYFDLRFVVYGVTVDQIGAGLVVLFIVRTGWELLADGMRVLLDASIDRDSLEQARKIIYQEPLVTEVQSLVGRNAGRFRFLQADITLRTEDLSKAHRVSQAIEKKIKANLSHVHSVVVHFQPQPAHRLRTAIPMQDMAGTISHHFGEAPYFAFVDIQRQDRSIEQQNIVSNPYQNIERGKGIKVAEWLVEQKTDQVLVREDIKNKGPGYVFANAGIDVQQVSNETLIQVLQEQR